MGEHELDCLVATGALNVNYLTGYWRYYNLPAAVVLRPDGHCTLLVTRDELAHALDTAAADQVEAWNKRGFGLDLDMTAELLDATTKTEALPTAKRIGVADGLGGTAAGYRERTEAVLISADDEILRMRHQKDPDELEKLSRCYGLAWVAVDAVRAAAETGATEIEMFTQALAAAQLAHGEPLEFSADLLCGPNTADDGPKRIAGSRRVSVGESVTADIRVGVGGYWSDICETHIVASNDEIMQTRNALIEIQTAAAAQLSPRSTGAAIY
jgi:Xaa-Pro aminopeptidase